MKILRRILCGWLIFSFLGTSITLTPAFAQSNTANAPGLLFRLPKPGARVNLSPAFEPVLIKGLKIHPENPFLFDFIVDPGQEKLNSKDFQKTSQRLINYFLASLAVPQKDLWVNLSPVEKNRIIPDALNKTELGRDLLAEDYILKQVGASLIYPESSYGKKFWAKVYDEAYQKFGVTQIPVNVFNKIWILPEKASVYEKGNTVYIVKAHLKVMLEEDYLAQKILGKNLNNQSRNVPVKEISKQIMREVVIPAIEKEVNEDQNFAQVRQVFYSLILAQWYQDVFKKSVLNKLYSGRNKVAGIDFNDPKNKELIYRQYISAYKKGVFNYIKEETDRISQQPIPRKYFSGGFVGRHVNFAMASASDMAMLQTPPEVDVSVALETSDIFKWYESGRPQDLKKELESMIGAGGTVDEVKLRVFIDTYSAYLQALKRDPVESPQPVFKSISLLSKEYEDALIKALSTLVEKYKGEGEELPDLVDKIFLFHHQVLEGYSDRRFPDVKKTTVYLLAAEIQYWTGGLGPVMEFIGLGMKELGANVNYIGARYHEDKDGVLLDYKGKDIGFQKLEENVDQFTMEMGEKDWQNPNKRGIIARRGSLKDAEWSALVSSEYIDRDGNLLAKSDDLRNMGPNQMSLPGLGTPQKIKLYNLISHIRGWTQPESRFAHLEAFIAEGILDRVGTTGDVLLNPERYNIERIREIAGPESADQVLGIFKQFESPKPLRQVDVVVDKGVDRHGLTAYLLRDVQPDGKSYYTKMLYNYGLEGKNPVTQEESMAFLNVASAELLSRLENKRQREIKTGETFTPAIVHGNDGQYAPLQAVTLSRHGSEEAIKGIVWAFTTHTYKNRGGNGDIKWAIDTFFKHMMGISDYYVNAARRDGYIDYTSLGVNLADVVGYVSKRHLEDMGRLDPNAHQKQFSFTNGSVADQMAKVFRDEFDDLKRAGIIPQTADFERPTAFEVAETKKATKRKLNQMGITSSLGRPVIVDVDSVVMGFVRRLVAEKVARGDEGEMGLINGLIRFLVRRGANIVLGGQYQTPGASEILAHGRDGKGGLRALEKEISDNQAEYKGKFYFVEKFSQTQKIALLAAFDGQFQISAANEANGATEEAILPNGGYNIVSPGGIGYMTAQGIVAKLSLDELTQKYVIVPGSGDILRPRMNTPDGWEELYGAFMDLWEQGNNHLPFYEGASLGPRLERSAYYELTSAANLDGYQNVITRARRHAKADQEFQQRIVQTLSGNHHAVNSIVEGNARIQPFQFSIFNRPQTFKARGSGLGDFLDEVRQLQSNFGYNAVLQYYLAGNFQDYLVGNEVKQLPGLFSDTPAEGLVKEWIQALGNDIELTNEQKEARLIKFMEDLNGKLKGQLSVSPVSPAQVAEPGGIKFDDIKVERHGNLTTDIISDKSLENLLINANGVYGVIVGVTLIPNLADFIQ